jgi:peptide/nickel transport system substrate-binding protein
MDPHKSTSQAAVLFSLIGNTGTRLNRDATEVVPELVTDWEQADDLTLTFKMRQGKWHNGREMDAEDAVFNLKRIAGQLEPDQVSRYQRRTTLTGMDTAEAVDERTVKVTFTQPTSTFLGGLSDFRNSWIPRDFFDNGGDFTDPNTLVGSGAFMVDNWEDEVKSTFKANPEYWKNADVKDTWPAGGEGGPYVDGFEMVWVPDNTSAIAALAAGDIDYFIAPSATNREAIKKLAPDAREEIWPFGNWHHWRFNPQRKPFDDPRVRQALFRVPKYDQMADASLGEGYWSYTGPLTAGFGEAIPSADIAQMPGWNPATKEADIAEAMKLMSAAVGDDPTFDVPIMPPNATQSGYYFDSSVRLVDQLKNVWPNINATLDIPADSATFGKRQVEGDFGTIVYIIFPQPDPVLELQSQYLSTGSRNYGDFSDPEIDALLLKAGSTFDSDAKAETLVETQQKLIDEHMYIVTIDMPSYHTWFRPQVKGMEGFGGRIDGGAYDVWRHTEHMWIDA